jgi:hypothetical protein
VPLLSDPCFTHFTEEQWDTAYSWLCKRRCNYPPNSDIWHLRFNWAREKSRLIRDLEKGRYQFDPLQSITKQDGQTIHLWSSHDALVLKLITLHLSTLLPISKRCTHVKSHGGLKATVNQVNLQRDHYKYVIRTDVKAYYASINHHLAINQLSIYIKNKALLNMLWQYMNRTVERGGLFKDITKGISRGCPLSPLIGAFFLNELDEGFEQDGLFYVRYMDDILILTKTRWKCRRAVKQLNEAFNQLRLEKHPDKTFIGKVEKGFDFLGYHFSPQGLRKANITWNKFVARWHRLYEQKKHALNRNDLLDDYVRRWQRWTTAGLGNITLTKGDPIKGIPLSGGIPFYQSASS